MSETPGPEPKPITQVVTKTQGVERPHHPHGIIGRAEKLLRRLTHQEARVATPLHEVTPPAIENGLQDADKLDVPSTMMSGGCKPSGGGLFTDDDDDSGND